jgi:hypothetical protein
MITHMERVAVAAGFVAEGHRRGDDRVGVPETIRPTAAELWLRTGPLDVVVEEAQGAPGQLRLVASTAATTDGSRGADRVWSVRPFVSSE